MARGSRTRPLSLIVFGLVIVGLLLGLSFASLRRFERGLALADHTVQVGVGLGGSLRLLTDAETGQRGFLLTGDPAHLEPFERGRAQLPLELQTIAGLLTDEPTQRARLGELRALANNGVVDEASPSAGPSHGAYPQEHDGGLAGRG